MPKPQRIDAEQRRDRRAKVDPREERRVQPGLASIEPGQPITEINTGQQWIAGKLDGEVLPVHATQFLTELDPAKFRLERDPDPFDDMMGEEVVIEFSDPPAGYRDGKVYLLGREGVMLKLRQGRTTKWVSMETIKSIG